MPEQPNKPLIRHKRETYGVSFNADLVEQYKVFVQSAENVSARRVSFGQISRNRKCRARRPIWFSVRRLGPYLLADSRCHSRDYRFHTVIYHHQVAP